MSGLNHHSKYAIIGIAARQIDSRSAWVEAKHGDYQDAEVDLGKALHFMGSSRNALRGFPKEVKNEVGFSLQLAQDGTKAINVVPLVGFGGASVLEIISDHDGDTFRAVYTVQFPLAVYVLHAFQKKSLRGRQTPKREIDLVRQRLRDAEGHYREVYDQRDRELRNAKRPLRF